MDYKYTFHEMGSDTRPLNKNVAKLGKMVTDRVGVKIDKDAPEYFGLNAVISDEEAAVALKMGLRKPKTFEEIMKKTKMSEEELRPIIDHLSEVGVVEWNHERPDHQRQYQVAQFIPGSAEFTNMNEKQLEAHPELADFFDSMTFLPMTKVTPMVPPGGAGIGMHVVPVEKAIEHENTTADVEHISHWLDKYDAYAKSPCSCRLERRTKGEGCGDDPEDWCIAVGDMAHYVVETNKGGTYISREEVLDILERAEEMGYVHQITNIDGENKILGICNCNINICNALRTSQLFNTPNLSRSAYVARVEKENCVACGQCVEHCPAGAVKLGQKLCTNHGEIQYPKHELPDAVRWDESKWDWNYRDTARIQTYATGTSPCKTACPAHIAIQGYLQLAKEGRYAEALELIKKDNPLPAVCGRICNRRCEAECTRGNVDEAISIDEVKNFIAQQDLFADTRYIPKKEAPTLNPNGFPEKVAVIGAGPAGLSCAYYLALKGYHPTVFDRNEKPGGMLVYGIPSFKLEKDVVTAEIDVLREMGVEFKCGVNVGEDLTLDDLRAQGYKAFYLGIGCQGGRKAGVPGEDAENVEMAVNFLRKVGQNEDYKISGPAVVIGGGNVAIDVARTAHRCGADSVTMFCLEQRDEMPASDEEIADAEGEGTVIQNGWGPKEIVLDENGRAKAVVFKKCTSVFNEEHRFSPSYDEDNTMTVDADNVYLSIGQSIVWGHLLDGEKVELGRGNGAVADPKTYQTTQDDIFVGGDVYTGPKFVIDAIAAGRMGAESIHRYVQRGTDMRIGRDWREYVALNKMDVVIGEYDKTPRQKAGFNSAIDEKNSFRDAKLPFTEEQVQMETARCLKCGASVVDENKCIGCGICTTHCKFDAIHLHREHPECSTMVRTEDKMKAILPYALKRQVKIHRAERAAKKNGIAVK